MVHFALGCILIEFVLLLWHVSFFYSYHVMFLTGIMERLDQGHPHPRHVLAGNRTQASMVGSEHSSKQLFEQLINSYPEHLHELTTWLPPSVHIT
jgi:hypothetical protein